MKKLNNHNQLREIRKEKKITVAELAEAIDVTPKQIYLYERKLSEPSLENWEKLANVLKVSPALLVFGSDCVSHYDLND